MAATTDGGRRHGLPETGRPAPLAARFRWLSDWTLWAASQPPRPPGTPPPGMLPSGGLDLICLETIYRPS